MHLFDQIGRTQSEEPTPVEALESTLNVVIGTITNGPRGRPGEVVSRMPERIRKALRELRSSDVADVRPDYFL